MGEKEVGSACAIISEGKVVGCITHDSPLSDDTFETIVVKFDKNYCGEVVSSEVNPLTYAQNISGGDVDIVSPVVMVSSTRQETLHTMSSGTISTVTGRKNAVVTGNRCSVTILTAGSKPTSIIKWFIDIPVTVNLLRKVIYIEKFNVYITGADRDHLKDISRRNTQLGILPSTICSMKVTGDITVAKRLHYRVCGIIGSVHIDPVISDELTIQVLMSSESGDNITHQVTIPNKELLDLTTDSYYSLCSETGDEMLFDIDQSRLKNSVMALKGHSMPRDISTAAIINKLRAEISRLTDSQRNDNSIIESLRQSIVELSMSQKEKREELMTKREEYKTSSAESSADSAMMADSLKVAAAIIGLAAVVTTIIIKTGGKSGTHPITKVVSASVSSHVQDKVLEWALPTFGLQSIGKLY